MEWQPIETAPQGKVILICDRKGEMPYTIAVAECSEKGILCYSGTCEQVDFEPEFWGEMGADNPFHTPLPAPPVTA